MSTSLTISAELSTAVGDDLEKFAVSIFKNKGLVKGKVSLRYGDGFQFKIEAYSNDEVSKELAKELSETIMAYADKTFEEFGMTRSKITSKYGSHYTIVIQAELLVLGRNNVNIASAEADFFRMICHNYGMTEETLGNEAIIGGKKYFFAGVQCKRNGAIHVYLQDEAGNIFISRDEKTLRHFGGVIEQVANA